MKKTLLGVTMAVALTLGVVACGSGDDSNDKPTITIAHQNDGIDAISELSGVFDDAGYNVKWAAFEYGMPLVQAISSAHVDVGPVGPVPPILASADDLDFRVSAAGIIRDPNTSYHYLIAPKGSPLKTTADLRGKKVAATAGSSAHGFLIAALQRAGLSINDITMVNLDPSKAQAAFAAGDVDAWVSWIPQARVVIDEQGAVVLERGIRPNDYGDTLWVTSTKTLADPDRRADVADALQRLDKAYTWGVAHPDEWAKAYARKTGLDEATAKKIAIEGAIGLSPVTPEIEQTEQDLADNFYSVGEIKKKIDFRAIVDNLVPEGETQP